MPPSKRIEAAKIPHLQLQNLQTDPAAPEADHIRLYIKDNTLHIGATPLTGDRAAAAVQIRTSFALGILGDAFIEFDTIDLQTAAMFDLTAPTLITIPANLDGIWHIYADVRGRRFDWSSNGGPLVMEIQHNTAGLAYTEITRAQDPGQTDTLYLSGSLHTIGLLSAGDTLRLRVAESESLNNIELWARFGAFRIGA